jgi:hypothetical protein
MVRAPYMMENPVTMLSSIPHIGKPNYYFNPADYTGFELGDNYTKKTCIWAGNGFVMPDPSLAPGSASLTIASISHRPVMIAQTFSAAAPMGFSRAVFQANAPHLKRIRAAQENYDAYRRSAALSSQHQNNEAG